MLLVVAVGPLMEVFMRFDYDLQTSARGYGTIVQVNQLNIFLFVPVNRFHFL